jgi:hypothetical protein
LLVADKEVAAANSFTVSAVVPVVAGVSQKKMVDLIWAGEELALLLEELELTGVAKNIAVRKAKT